MFSIKNLHVAVNKKTILSGITLNIKPGEIHVVMGPNGAGKSTLANALMGHPKYTITKGKISLKKKDLTRLEVNKRAIQGLFLAFQHPKEIPGVTVFSFLHTAFSALNKMRGKTAIDSIEFRKLLRKKMKELNLDAKFMSRYINDGFSGGEKKKMEILQMAMLEPDIAILDETDSGLDVDALKIVAKGIKAFAKPSRSILLITHYQHLLHYIKPDFVHIMMNGKIVKSGTAKLAEKIEKEGYEWLLNK